MPEEVSRRALLRRGGALASAAFVAPRFDLPFLRHPPAVGDRRLAPDIIRRAQWGADEARRGIAEYDAVIEKIVVHHTGTENKVASWVDQVRRIYENEVASDYRDIAYHYLVDPKGRIYEGRWARKYAADDPPDGEDERGWNVRGGHALRHNPRALGIALLGDYTKVAPTDRALDAILDVLAWKCARWHIDPVGETPYCATDGTVETLPNIVPHGQVRVTECPGPYLERALDELRDRTAARVGHQEVAGGYRVVGAGGRELAFGDADRLHDDAPAPVAGIVTSPGGGGYWAFGPDGGVFAYGSAAFHGSLAGQTLNGPIVGLAPAPGNDGYWTVAADGGVFAFGNAAFAGSVAGQALRASVCGIAPSPSGRGYWCAAADGGVFAFGDAPVLGSLANTQLSAPVTAIVAAGNGFWLAAADGGVFAFGDAPYFGSGTPGAAVVAMTPTTTGQGYYLLTGAGDVVPFGDATYHGSANGRLPDAVGIAPA
ncbi:MAG TPA: peptidoglycan recognition family protein [Acidimicrobiia bacterium]|nr:peptidoglycan recognition family protein [Acidimicrobiia bacterium]